MKKLFLFILMLFFGLTVFCQRYTIKGKVVDSATGEKLMYANCMLHYTTDTLGIYKGEVTDTNGEFVIKKVKKRDFILEISYVGYKLFKKIINESEFKDNKIITVGDISLELNDALQGVEIVAKRKRIEIDDDKLKVNVDEQMASTVDNAFDLLKLVPGVMIDNQDNLKLNGKSGVQFQYNSREMKMSWDGIKDMLKSMSPEMIDQFEVLKNPGVKYDAEGTAGIINIKLKKNQNYGINGSVNLSVSYQDELTYGYRPNGRLNFVNDKWMISAGAVYGENWFGIASGLDSSYRYSWINNDTTLFRSLYDEDYQSKSIRNSYDLSASYSIDTTSTITFEARYAQNHSPFSSKNDITYILHNPLYIIDSVFNNCYGSKNKNKYMGMSVGYVKKLDTLDSKFSSDLDFSYNTYNTNSISEVNYYKGENINTDNLLRYQGYKRKNDSKSYNISWRADYFKNIGKTMRFEAGVQTKYSYDDRDYHSFLKEDEGYINNVNESNRFKYQENINSLYASFTAKFFDKKLSLRAGLRLEQTNTKGEQETTDSINTRHYSNVFPSVRIGYKFTEDNELGINYSYRISRPWSESLNPFIEKNSDYSYSTGNPYLEPKYSHYVSLEHSFKYMLFSSVSYSYTKNNINSLSVPLDSTYNFTHSELALIDYPVNLGNSQSVSFDLSFDKDIIQNWYLSLNGGVSYDKINSSSQKEAINREGWSYNFSLNTFATLPYKIRLSAFYMFYSASYWGITKGSNWQWFSASLGKSFFDDKLSMNIACNWSLNQKSHDSSEYMNYKSESWSHPDRPNWNFSIRYKFGKFYQNKQVQKMQLEDFDQRSSGEKSR